MTVKETAANLIVAAAEKTAMKSSVKASTWIRFQPKEPASVQKWAKKSESKL